MNLRFEELNDQNFEDFIGLLNAIKIFEGDPELTVEEIHILKNDRSQFGAVVAYLEKDAVAFAFYFQGYSSFKCGPTLFIDDLFVLEKYRGQGFGSQVFTECVRIAKQENIKRVEWTTRIDNFKAQDFYKKLNTHKSNKIFYRMEEDEINHFSI